MLTREDLDRMTCANPECDHVGHDVLYLHGRCHPGGKIEVSYRVGSGVLRVGCKQCGRVIALVKVAAKGE